MWGGRAIGAWVLGRRRADDIAICECCACGIEVGDPVYDCVKGDGRRLVVCSDCCGGGVS